MSEWKDFDLISVCEKIGSGATPRGGKEAYQESGISLIRSQNVHDFRFSKDGLVHIDTDQANKLKNVIVKENDVLINITGDSVGRVCSAPKEFIPARVNQHVAIIRPKKENLDWEYLKYFLLSPYQKAYLLMLSSSGATRNALTKGMLENLKIHLPPLSEQKAIAHILGSLDDKIELNRKMNQTLEAMARALFKSWFVDFDPVMDNALAAGNAIPEELQAMAEKRRSVIASDKGAKQSQLTSSKRLIDTNPQLAAKFPSSFVYNETLGKWIPEGWTDTDITECLKTVSKTYNLKNVDEIIFLNTGDIEEGKFLHSNYSKVKGLPGQAKKSIQEGDILYSEIRPKNKRFAYVYFNSSDYVVSTKLMVLRPKNEIDPLFYYQILKSESTLTELQFLAESRSGTFPQITYDILKAIRFVLPKQLGILGHYTKVLRTNFERSMENQKQTEILTQLRDRLLPELISGRVRVKKEIKTAS